MRKAEMMKKHIFRLFLLTAAFFLIVFRYDTPAHAEDGEDAWLYMQYLEQNFPNRCVASSELDACAEWLKTQVGLLGYEYESQKFSVPQGEGVIISGENIIFSKPGENDGVVVVGAHYDTVLTNGTDDNGSGVALLLELASKISEGEYPPYSVRFILFSAEEIDCVGSQYYVDSLSSEEKSKIICMINLDTIGAGDNMYLYGGGVTEDGKEIRTWLAEQAEDDARMLGLDMYFHPDVNSAFPGISKASGSDQQAFDLAGIAYLYCEASNWNGGSFSSYYQTSDPAVADGMMMHVREYENLKFYTETFGNRIQEHLKSYAILIRYLLYHLKPYDRTGVDPEELETDDFEEAETSDPEETDESPEGETAEEMTEDSLKESVSEEGFLEESVSKETGSDGMAADASERASKEDSSGTGTSEKEDSAGRGTSEKEDSSGTGTSEKEDSAGTETSKEGSVGAEISKEKSPAEAESLEEGFSEAETFETSSSSEAESTASGYVWNPETAEKTEGTAPELQFEDPEESSTVCPETKEQTEASGNGETIEVIVGEIDRNQRRSADWMTQIRLLSGSRLFWVIVIVTGAVILCTVVYLIRFFRHTKK